MLDRSRARDRQHHRRFLQQPRKHHLRWRRAELLRQRLYLRGSERANGVGRIPREKCHAEALARLEHVLGAAIAKVVAVLHRDDGHESARLLELLHRDVGEADVPDFPLALEVRECADLDFERHLRVGRMQLVEVDALELEALQAALEILAQLLGPAVLVPARGLRAREAAFRADDEVLRIRVHRLGDSDFAGVRAVALGGIEEIGAELVGAAHNAVRVRLVFRWAPDVRVLDDAHRAVADAVDVQVADLHSSACLSSSIRSSTSSIPTDRRTKPSLMPRPARTSSGSEACVMIAGCSIRLSTPPRLSASVKSLQRSRKRFDAPSPPLSTAVTLPP